MYREPPGGYPALYSSDAHVQSRPLRVHPPGMYCQLVNQLKTQFLMTINLESMMIDNSTLWQLIPPYQPMARHVPW